MGAALPTVLGLTLRSVRHWWHFAAAAGAPPMRPCGHFFTIVGFMHWCADLALDVENLSMTPCAL